MIVSSILVAEPVYCSVIFFKTMASKYSSDKSTSFPNFFNLVSVSSCEKTLSFQSNTCRTIRVSKYWAKYGTHQSRPLALYQFKKRLHSSGSKHTDLRYTVIITLIHYLYKSNETACIMNEITVRSLLFTDK